MTNGEQFIGAILAGGRGRRMFPFSERYPKPLLPVCNKPLIVHQIETMRALGIRDIVVLIGHKGYRLSMVLGDGSAFGVRLRYVEQEEMLGIAHGVGRMEGEIDRPFLLFLGDIFFVPENLEQMFAAFREQRGGAVLAVKDEADPEAIRKNYTAELAADGYVTRVIEKPRHARNRLKGVGIYLFDLTVFDAIRRTPRTAMRDEYEITDAIQVMIDDNLPVRVRQCILDDVNITTPVDLLRCNLIRAKECRGEELIGANTRIHPEASLERCVIGSNVVIENPIPVRNSVILDNTLIDATEGYDGFVLTPDAVVNCNYQDAGVRENRWA